jgi:hypothetical protein
MKKTITFVISLDHFIGYCMSLETIYIFFMKLIFLNIIVLINEVERIYNK